jgi:site-specific DNA-methyltransferase (adenine-specific)
MLDRWRNTIQNQDCIEGMEALPPRSVDLVIADPPYNLSKGGDWSWDNTVKLQGFGGAWRKRKESWDDMTLEEYFRFSEAWLTQVKRVLKPTGSFWICGTYHNMGVINVLLQQLDMEILNEIVWYKRNSFPNLSGRRFTASHETLLWGHVGGKERKYYFDYEGMKEAEFPEDLLKKPGKQMRTVWDIPNNKTPEELRYGTHPAQKPLKLLRRILLATSRVGDLVLVPFAGVGSECVAAKQLGRDFMGFEINPEYCQIARRRLEITPVEATMNLDGFVKAAANIDAPAVETSYDEQLSLPFQSVNLSVSVDRMRAYPLVCGE